MAPLATALIELSEYHYGKRWLLDRRRARTAFHRTTKRTWSGSFGQKNRTPYVKDAFHRYVINGEQRRRESRDEGDEGGRALRRGNCARRKLDDSRSPAGPTIPAQNQTAATEILWRGFR